MAFFPNYLKWRYRMYKKAARTPIPQDHNITCEEALNFLRSQGNLYEPHLFLSDYDLTELSKEFLDTDASYEIATNQRLRTTLHWISKRMMSTIGVDHFLTVDVYTRISTSMLNKLVEENVIDKNLAILYHDNLIRNLNDLISCLNEESLPF